MSKGQPTKSRRAAKSAPAETRPNTVADLRLEIDRLDRELVKLMCCRAELARDIGKIKDSTGQRTYDPGREEEVLARAVANNPGPLQAQCIRAVFRELISGSRALEKALRVAYLGPLYSYSHLATVHRFGQSAELVPVSNIAAVFEEVHRGHADYGIVPIENSTDGRIADTLEMFTRVPVRICGEVQMGIHHYLLGKCQRGEVQEVYSKPQAISQCRNWLSKHVPDARLIEVTSTSTAAQLASEKPGAAAIASRQAGDHYGLDVLAENIEDNAGNVTRFAIIGDRQADRTGHDKTAIMFEIEHKPGALAEALTIFKRRRLNLTWIESFPIARSPGVYFFFVEVEGHPSDARLKRAIEALEEKAVRLTVLGCYARTAQIN